MNSKGFTIIELLIVVSIIGVLSAVVLASVGDVRDKAYQARAESETKSFREALQLYMSDHGNPPADVSRGIPSGLESYLSSNHWPEAPWPNSSYDWDNWDINGQDVYQISIRFCEQNQPETCDFPNKDWADDFKINSAVYHCIEGPCRSHESEPFDYPGYCLNCRDNN